MITTAAGATTTTNTAPPFAARTPVRDPTATTDSLI
jgi:hypothetical protein